MTWQKIDNDKDKDKDNDKDKDIDNPRDLRHLRHLIRVMRGHDLTNIKTKTKTMTKTIPEICDTRNTNYNSYN